jgi:predicted phosphodiesterase
VPKGKTKPSSDEQVKQLKGELKELRKAHKAMANRMSAGVQNHPVSVQQYFWKVARFGVISDTHYGSSTERPDLALKAYKIMHREGIRVVYHAGDFVEGHLRPGHEFELKIVGADAQRKHAIKVHPKVKGMRTLFILGNHDFSFVKRTGYNIGPDLAAERDDLEFIGGTSPDATGLMNPCVSDQEIVVGGVPIRMRLEHPSDGTAYAISYKSQKAVEALAGGRKPHILVLGHYHKSELLPMVRNVITMQPGCFQSQSAWMQTKHLKAHVGFWMCEVRATKKPAGIARFKAEFVPFYEL